MTSKLTAAQEYTLRLLNDPGKIALYQKNSGDWTIDGKYFSASVLFLIESGLAERCYSGAIISKQGCAFLVALDKEHKCKANAQT